MLHVQLNVNKKSNCYFPLEHVWYMMHQSGKKHLKELHTCMIKLSLSLAYTSESNKMHLHGVMDIMLCWNAVDYVLEPRSAKKL